MVKDKRLEKFIGKTVIVINKDHPHYHSVGKGVSFDELATGGFGLKIDFTNGLRAYVMSASEINTLESKDTEVLTNEEIIEQLSACNYGPTEIAMYLEINPEQFLKEWNNPHSNIRFYYDKGKLTATFDINQKLLDNAKTGNITAAQIFLKNSELKRAEDLKRQIFYGFES